MESTGERRARADWARISGGRSSARRGSNNRLMPTLTGSIDCAQQCARIAGDASISSGSPKGRISQSRRLRQCKILICEVLVSVTLSVRGEVAEWPKAAVC